MQYGSFRWELNTIQHEVHLHSDTSEPRSQNSLVRLRERECQVFAASLNSIFPRPGCIIAYSLTCLAHALGCLFVVDLARFFGAASPWYTFLRAIEC